MSDEISENATQEDDTTNAPHLDFNPPFRWIGLSLGLTTCTVLGIVTLLLFSQFVRSRPVDLTHLTLESKRIIDQFLINNRVPPSSVNGGVPIDPKFLATSTHHLHTFEYDIELSSNFDMEQFLGYLTTKLMKIDISVSDMPSNLGDGGLRLSYNGQEFGRVMVDQMDRYDAAATKSGLESLRPNTTPIASGLDSIKQRKIIKPLVVSSSVIKTLPLKNIETFTPERKARIAIIIDDGGYGGKLTDIILGLDTNLTLSILPNTPYGTAISRDAAALGFEIMLHMPMENHSPDMVHEGQLDVDMNPGDVRRLTEDALKQIPEAVGINNHTGSKYTEVDSALKDFMDVIDDTGLYFIDSRTSPKTIALDVAKSFSIPSNQRDLFIDHDEDKESIRRRFKQSMEIALENGEAIVIGHFRPNTAELLVELLPELEENGIELVHVSEIIQ